MDIQAYISSGILETYLLGGCTLSEIQEVERIAAEYPVVRAELDKIELGMEGVAKKFAVKPSDQLRKKIIDAVESEAQEHAKPPRNHGAKEPQKSSPWNLGMGLAAAIGMLLAGYFYMQSSDAQSQLQAKQTELKECSDKFARAQSVERQIALINSTQTKRFDIAPIAEGSAPRSASVYSNTAEGNCLVSVAGMDTAPAGKSFQLWALVDGKPVSLGVIDTDTDKNTFREIACTSSAQAYAISLEPKGGSATPTEVIMISKT